MSDDILKELARALDVDPSPAFAAKVRREVEQVASRRGRLWAWRPAWAFGMATVLMAGGAGVLWVRLGEEASPRPVAPVPVVAQAEPRVPVRSVPSPTAAAVIGVRQDARVQKPRARPAGPEVLVPNDQAHAIFYLLRAARGEVVEPPPQAEVTPPEATGDVPRPAPIVIPLIEIVPVMRESQGGTKENR